MTPVSEPLSVIETPAPPAQYAPPPATVKSEGNWFTVKVSILVAVPPRVVTATAPVVPVPTVTVTEPAVFAVIAAVVPPIVTAVALDKLVPLIMRDDPTHPL